MELPSVLLSPPVGWPIDYTTTGMSRYFETAIESSNWKQIEHMLLYYDAICHVNGHRPEFGQIVGLLVSHGALCAAVNWIRMALLLAEHYKSILPSLLQSSESILVPLELCDVISTVDDHGLMVTRPTATRMVEARNTTMTVITAQRVAHLRTDLQDLLAGVHGVIALVVDYSRHIDWTVEEWGPAITPTDSPHLTR